MNRYPEGQIVEITVPFKDRNGEDITPTGITAVLYDGEDEVVVDFGVVAFNAPDGSVMITALSAANQFSGDNLEEVRRLVVTMTHASGSVIASHPYVIEAEQSLQIMRSSFMTFETAEMLSDGMVNLTAYKNASDERKRAALFEAFRRITTLSMKYASFDEDGSQIASGSIRPVDWEFVSADDFKTLLPGHFQKALRYGQVTEADEILRGDVMKRKHALGIASETVGESSMTFRDGFAGSGSKVLSSAALAVLKSYIDQSATLTRIV